ncbi:MAG: homoserine dehydrogenase [Desulfovibrionaceae bacterium]|nr:homoserine dehydrogenase [Desulfovibrionaceae bacterium]
MSNLSPLVIGLAGFGTVGSGLAEALRLNHDLIRARIGRDVRIKTVLVRDLKKPRTYALPEGATVTVNPDELINDPEIDILVELMGGKELAFDLISDALRAGKNVVTANKALLAEKGTELFNLAAEKNLGLAFEASVCGAIPILQVLRESLAGNKINSLMGILNGTSNYILSEMSERGLPFETALREAQAKGYAEADPTFDIEGVDAAHKLTLLIRMAFGVNYPFSKLGIQGISEVSTEDIAFARELGYRIKLLGQARWVDGKIEAGVYPTLVSKNMQIAGTDGVFNAVHVEANAAGPVFMHGRGAGGLATASAVLGDILEIARCGKPNNTGFVNQYLPAAEIMPSDESISQHYLHLMVNDKPGVLRDLAGALAEQGVSVAQAIQKEQGQSHVPIVFLTHEAPAKAINNALALMQAKSLLGHKPVHYRVLK